MSTKMLLATLVGGVVSFFLGWLVFGILLDPYYKSHMVNYEGLMRNMETGEVRMVGIALAQFCFAGLLAYIFDRWANIRNFAQGFMGGFIVMGLAYAGFNIFMWSTMNLGPYIMYAVDIVANAIFGGVIGGVIGWMLGRGKSA